MAKKDDIDNIPEVDPSRVRKTTLTFKNKKSMAQIEKETGTVIKVKGVEEPISNSETLSARKAHQKKVAYQTDKQQLAAAMLKQAGDTPQNRKKIASAISMMSAAEIAEILSEHAKELLYSPEGVQEVKPISATEYNNAQRIIKRAAKLSSDEETISAAVGTLGETNQDKMEMMTPETVLQGKFIAGGVYEAAKDLLRRYQEYQDATIKPPLSEEDAKAFSIIRATKLNPKMMVSGQKSFDTDKGTMYDDEGEEILQGGSDLVGLSEVDVSGLTEEEWKMQGKGQHGAVVIGILGKYATEISGRARDQGEYYSSTDGYDVMTPSNVQTDPYLLGKEYSVSMGLLQPTDVERSILGRAKGIRGVNAGVNINLDYDDSMAKAGYSIGVPEVASKQQYLDAIAELYINIDYQGEDRDSIKQKLSRYLDTQLETGFKEVSASNRIENALFEQSMKEFVGNKEAELYKPKIRSYMSALPDVREVAGMFGGAIVEPLTRYGQDPRFYEGDVDTASSILRIASGNLRQKDADQFSDRQLYDATMLMGLKYSTSMAAEKFYRVGGSSFEDSTTGKGIQKNYRNFGDEGSFDGEYGSEEHLQHLISQIDKAVQEKDISALDRTYEMEGIEFKGESDRFARDEFAILTDPHFEPTMDVRANSNMSNLQVLREELEDELAAKIAEREKLEYEEDEEEAELIELEEEEEEPIETTSTSSGSPSAGGYEQGTFNLDVPVDVDHTTVEAPNVTRSASGGMTSGGAPLVNQTVSQTGAAPNVKMDAVETRANLERDMLDKFFKANPHLERGPEQRTPEWFAARENQITSSVAGSFLFNANNAVKKRLSNIFNPRPPITNEHIERGKTLEPIIKAEWEKQNPDKMLVDVGLVRNKNLNVGSTSPDAMIFDRKTGEWTGKLAEIKAPMSIKEGNELEAQRAKHGTQMQHQMMVMGASGNTLIQGVQELSEEDVGRRSGSNTGKIRLDTSDVNYDPIWERDNKKKLLDAQSSLDKLVGLDKSQLNDMLDSNMQTLGKTGKMIDNKTPYIFTEEHGRVLQQQDQDYVSGRSRTGASSKSGGGGGGRTTTKTVSEDDDDDDDGEGLGLFGKLKGMGKGLLGKMALPIAAVEKLGELAGIVGKGAEGANNFIGAAYDIGMKPSDFTSNASSMMAEGMTLGQATTAMGQSQLMAGGMEVGMFDGAKKLVIATRGALTFEDIQKYGDNPEALMKLLRSRTGGQVSERGLMAMLSGGGLDTSLLRTEKDSLASDYLGATNLAKTFSKTSNALGAGVALSADSTSMKDITGSLNDIFGGGPSYTPEEQAAAQSKDGPRRNAGSTKDTPQTSTSESQGRTMPGMQGHDRVDVVVHVKADGINVAGKRGNQTVEGKIGPQGRQGPGIGSNR